jgi:hypothetical protein
MASMYASLISSNFTFMHNAASGMPGKIDG